MFDTICGLVPSDPDYPARTRRLDILRRVLNPLSPVEAMELLISRLEKVRNNAEFLANMNQL